MPEVTGKQQFWKSAGNCTDKESEVNGTWDMPHSPAPSRTNPNERPKSKAEAKLAGSLLDEFGWNEKVAAAPEPEPEVDILEQAFLGGRYLKSNTEGAIKVANVMRPHVDVTNLDTPSKVEMPEYTKLAMPSIGRYPLDSYEQVKVASVYFEEHWKQMEPADRREYAYNLVNRATELDYPITKVAHQYGGEGYGPEDRVRAEVLVRKDLVKEAEYLPLYDELVEKINELPPDVFAHALQELDKVADVTPAYGVHCSDAWLTTYGREKTAADEGKDSIVVGNEYMTVESLKQFAQTHYDTMSKRFGEDMAGEFTKEPVTIFNSMPIDQKKVIMRMVAESQESTT